MNFLLKCQAIPQPNISRHLRNISVSVFRCKDYDLFHPEDFGPQIPPYVEKTSENMQIKRARLLYQSRKRGMLENGLLFSTFAKKYLDTFNLEQLKMYDRLINLPSNDWDIYNWATGHRKTPEEFDNEIMDLFKKHVRNEEKQARLQQPDL